ncbi:hypothetical protein DUNSADRAFT_9287 [Dunaliella salina]|uniref:Encoded protein n=1 Tax=Dunaliella salina TaxID=3046 RepID=A0ABQ7FSL4_DUNSA|nr:hypothetical protein DUNSADRAFT_9287 [Dunaliella salina]|eukprot:KAF5825494.1 hypothetical protein DUNSADRAFT_9287 [Dunaliella salina]
MRGVSQVPFQSPSWLQLPHDPQGPSLATQLPSERPWNPRSLEQDFTLGDFIVSFPHGSTFQGAPFVCGLSFFPCACLPWVLLLGGHACVCVSAKAILFCASQAGSAQVWLKEICCSSSSVGGGKGECLYLCLSASCTCSDPAHPLVYTCAILCTRVQACYSHALNCELCGYSICVWFS